MTTRIAAIFIAASIIFRIVLLAYTPTTWGSERNGLQAHNDEASHVNYVRFIMQNHRLPVLKQHCQEKNAFVRNEIEYHQAPLYYTISAVLAKVFFIHSTSVLTYFCRVVSLAFAMGSLWVLYHVARRRYTERAAILILLIASLLPVHIRHSVTASNDSLLWLFAAMLFGLISKRQSDDRIGLQAGSQECTFAFDRVHAIKEGVILGAATWAKASAFPIFGLYVAMAIFDWKRWRQWTLPFLIGLIIALPLILRNIFLYGELTGVIFSLGPIQKGVSTLDPYILYLAIRGAFESFFFPYDTIPTPLLLRLPAYLLWASICFVWCRMAWNNSSIRKRNGFEIGFELQMIFVLLLFGIGYAHFNWNHLQTEGRHIFPAFPAMLLALGPKINEIPMWQWCIALIGLLYPYLLVIAGTISA